MLNATFLHFGSFHKILRGWKTEESKTECDYLMDADRSSPSMEKYRTLNEAANSVWSTAILASGVYHASPPSKYCIQEPCRQHYARLLGIKILPSSNLHLALRFPLSHHTHKLPQITECHACLSVQNAKCTGSQLLPARLTAMRA